MRKDYLLYQSTWSLLSLLGRALGWFFEPRVRPLIRPWMRLALLMLPAIGIGVLLNRGAKYTGFYQLDSQGRPVRFLSTKQPESIQGRMGVSRNKFLEQVAANK